MKKQKAKRDDRLQSAMEYLMTYGWAILIVAIVLAALYSLGLFSTVGSQIIVCLGNPTFVCSTPVLGSGGGLTVNISYNTYDSPLTITGLGCNVTPSTTTNTPSVETTHISLSPGETRPLEFQCPILKNSLGSSTPVVLWIYYDTPYTSNQEEELAKGIVSVTYISTPWTVTEWTPASNSVDLLPYSDLTANPASPSAINVIETSQWSSSDFGSSTGWSYGTDYHNHDIYFGMETTLFPLSPLSLDDAPCSAPYRSHGYTAIAYSHMSGSYTFSTETDDGTEIFYRLASGGGWSNVFGGNAWTGQAPTLYTQSVNFGSGYYEIVIDYIDTCDPAGVSAISISPALQN